jgi:hypothetical protein
LSEMWQGFRDREQRREAAAREEKTAESLEATAIMTPSAPFAVVQYCSDLFWHSGYVGKSEKTEGGFP